MRYQIKYRDDFNAKSCGLLILGILLPTGFGSYHLRLGGLILKTSIPARQYLSTFLVSVDGHDQEASLSHEA